MFFLLHRRTDDGVFDDFPKICDHFPKIFENCSEGRRMFPNIFHKFSKISEDCHRLSRKTQRCFDHTAIPPDAIISERSDVTGVQSIISLVLTYHPTNAVVKNIMTQSTFTCCEMTQTLETFTDHCEFCVRTVAITTCVTSWCSQSTLASEIPKIAPFFEARIIFKHKTLHPGGPNTDFAFL